MTLDRKKFKTPRLTAKKISNNLFGQDGCFKHLPQAPPVVMGSIPAGVGGILTGIGGIPARVGGIPTGGGGIPTGG